MESKDKENILTLIRIIMSSESIHQQQREALDHFKTNPDLLKSVLQMSATSMDINSKNKEARPYASERALYICNKDNIPEHWSNYGRQTENLITKSTSDVPSMNETMAETYSNRKRKSTATQGKSKRTKYGTEFAILNKNTDKKSDNIYSRIEQLENVRFVHEMIEILLHPKSKQHQDAVLAILRVNDNIRKLFINERAKLGKQMIPIFKSQISNQNFIENTEHYEEKLECHAISHPSEIHKFGKKNGLLQYLLSPHEPDIPEQHLSEEVLGITSTNTNLQNIECDDRSGIPYMPINTGVSLSETLHLQQNNTLLPYQISVPLTPELSEHPVSPSYDFTSQDPYQDICNNIFCSD